MPFAVQILTRTSVAVEHARAPPSTDGCDRGRVALDQGVGHRGLDQTLGPDERRRPRVDDGFPLPDALARHQGGDADGE